MLLDQYGREIKSNKPVLDEVAVQTVRDRYGSYPSQGLTPQRLATIFKEADQGDVMRQAELFEEMEEKDLHLGGIMQTRKLAVTGLDWEVLPASDSREDKKIAAAAKEMIESVENFEDALLDTLDAVGKGFAVQEIMWNISGGKVWAKEIKWIHQRRFTFNTPTVLLQVPRLLTEAEQTLGEELLPNKFIFHRYRARSGATPRGGLYRPCAYMYLFKNYDIKDWLVFNELFSVPMRIGKYKQGAGTEEKEDLKRAVFNLGVDAAAVVSDNTIIELIEAKRTGDGGIFEAFVEFCDKAMSKSVLGHTGSSESTPGKLGGEDQAKEVRQDLLEADAKGLMKTIKTQLLRPWVSYNFGPDKGVPIWKLHFETEEDLEKTARVYGVLVKDAGFEGIPESHIYDRFGIPKPQAGEKTLRAAQPFSTGYGDTLRQGVPVSSTQANNLEMLIRTIAQSDKRLAVMLNSAGDGEPDWVARYMERLGPSLQNVRGAALDSIEEWLRSLSAPPPEEQFVAKISDLLGSFFAALDKNAISGMVTEIYSAYRAAPGMSLVLGGPDTRAIGFLAKLDNLYISSYFQNSDAQAVVKDFLKERYLDQGAGLFGRGKPEDIQAFKDLFGRKLADVEGWQIERIVDTSVQRVRNWASVSQLHEGGITEIEIYEPTMDCAFCQAMNGRIISVPTAYQKMTAQMGMSAEEYVADLQNTPATLDNLDGIVSSGSLPPYHPHCHGRALKRVG